MHAYTEGYGGLYEEVRGSLSDEQLRTIRVQISNSDRFEMGKLSHIVLAGTGGAIVGFLGIRSAELCCPNRGTAELYRTSHEHLRRIFRSV